MKSNRQKTIIDLIESRAVETQEELVSGLRDLGFQVTQATVSRDIRQMGLIKVSTHEGKYRYALPGRNEPRVNDRLTRMLSDSLVSVDYAENDVVVKTISGSANIAGEAIDSMEWKEVLGTIAGDNTIFIVTRNAQNAHEIAERIRGMMKN